MTAVEQTQEPLVLHRVHGAPLPVNWCMETAQMVRGLRAKASLHNCLAFPHGLAMDLDHIGVVDDAVTDCVSQRGII